ncbi:hypothetical protein BGW36DRAFT_432844 [Talaromyces proteolyticus]|uniref:Hydrophobin n=1 Tax=Talaromyces proteolyticus TaxID=1131652 RepID=A0AAD4PUY6_9EURO|nr:uncharacterized protein BGW36DRAFT_432844 [Talaromyces proteolyticus]KAH8689878.1 hypothetical protein BGW36DRAFT_432844 [Talaromyces proteolyticus]
MQCKALLTIAFAVAVAALPPSGHQAEQSNQISIKEAKDQCPGGEVACCINNEEINGDGVLGNLLQKGLLLNNVLGTQDSACAKTSLIENLNLLGFTQEGSDGPSCSASTACCSGDDCKVL